VIIGARLEIFACFDRILVELETSVHDFFSLKLRQEFFFFRRW